MIIEFPTKQNIFECFDCGEVRILRKEFPVCQGCPEPQTEDEKLFLASKFQVRGTIRMGLGDDGYYSSLLDMFRGMFADEQFAELQRIITIGRGRNLRVVK